MKVRFLVLIAGAGAAAVACADPLATTATLATIDDTAAVYALTGAPESAPTAINITFPRAVITTPGEHYDVVFDIARAAIAALESVASIADESSSWAYRHDRDLTGFIDGSENPDLIDAPDFAVVPNGSPGAGGSILLLQKWSHDATAWEALQVEQQEQVIGRTKDESVELDDKPGDSHVARTDQDQFGKIFRRNMPYGTVTDHGTMFVGFSADQRPLTTMLESMAGLPDGVRDTLTLYTQPLTGAYYFVPSIQSLRNCDDL